MGIEFESDLVITTDGLQATVHGEGPVLRVRTDDPGAFLREARLQGGTDVAGIARVSDLLAAEGVSVTLSGPDGDVASLGAVADSRLGRLATGSRHVEPQDLRTLAPLAVAGLRDRLLANPARLVGLAFGALLAWRALRRRP